jgi:hypothetical protein
MRPREEILDDIQRFVIVHARVQADILRLHDKRNEISQALFLAENEMREANDRLLHLRNEITGTY